MTHGCCPARLIFGLLRPFCFGNLLLLYFPCLELLIVYFLASASSVLCFAYLLAPLLWERVARALALCWGIHSCPTCLILGACFLYIFCMSRNTYSINKSLGAQDAFTFNFDFACLQIAKAESSLHRVAMHIFSMPSIAGQPIPPQLASLLMPMLLLLSGDTETNAGPRQAGDPLRAYISQFGMWIAF